MAPVAVTQRSDAHSIDTFNSSTLKKESNENQMGGAVGRTKDGRQLKIRSYPKFNSLEEERLYRKQHLAAAYRIFAERGFDEGVAGHISVRDPILTDHFWLNPLYVRSPVLNTAKTLTLWEDPCTSARSASRTSSSWTRRAA